MFDYKWFPCVISIFFYHSAFCFYQGYMAHHQVLLTLIKPWWSDFYYHSPSKFRLTYLYLALDVPLFLCIQNFICRYLNAFHQANQCIFPCFFRVSLFASYQHSALMIPLILLSSDSLLLAESCYNSRINWYYYSELCSAGGVICLEERALQAICVLNDRSVIGQISFYVAPSASDLPRRRSCFRKQMQGW